MSLATARDGSERVFIGRLISVEREGHPKYVKRLKFAVTHVYKGVRTPVAEILEDDGRATLFVEESVGATFLVFGEARDGGIWTDECLPNLTLEGSEADSIGKIGLGEPATVSGMMPTSTVLGVGGLFVAMGALALWRLRSRHKVPQGGLRLGVESGAGAKSTQPPCAYYPRFAPAAEPAATEKQPPLVRVVARSGAAQEVM